LDCEALNLLQQKLQTKENIVLITGAGISTNAGSKFGSYTICQSSNQKLAVPDFQSSSRSMQSSRKVYDSSAYSLQETATRLLNGDILSKLRRGQKASFTSFDLFAEKLAESGRLRRHYTQNIDCRQARLPSLSKKNHLAPRSR
jgi:NAD-dependent SIR2 family protein deacetylase